MTKKSVLKVQVSQAEAIRAAADNFINCLLPQTIWDEDGKTDLLAWAREDMHKTLLDFVAVNKHKFYTTGEQMAQEAYDNAIFAERVIQEAARSDGREIAGNVYQSDVMWKLKALAQRRAAKEQFQLLIDALHLSAE